MVSKFQLLPLVGRVEPKLLLECPDLLFALGVVLGEFLGLRPPLPASSIRLNLRLNFSKCFELDLRIFSFPFFSPNERLLW